jgi:hypothetical protein
VSRDVGGTLLASDNNGSTWRDDGLVGGNGADVGLGGYAIEGDDLYVVWTNNSPNMVFKRSGGVWTHINSSVAGNMSIVPGTIISSAFDPVSKLWFIVAASTGSREIYFLAPPYAGSIAFGMSVSLPDGGYSPSIHYDAEDGVLVFAWTGWSGTIIGVSRNGSGFQDATHSITTLYSAPDGEVTLGNAASASGAAGTITLPAITSSEASPGPSKESMIFAADTTVVLPAASTNGEETKTAEFVIGGATLAVYTSDGQAPHTDI